MSAKTSKKASAKKSKALQNKTTTTIKSELKVKAVVEKSTQKTFWQKQSLKAILGEFFGTMIFVTLATGDPYSGLGFSFGLAAIVMALFMISGGHVNPIVTIGLWSARKFEGAKVPFYVLAQLLGGFTSLLITRSLSLANTANAHIIPEGFFSGFLTVDWPLFIAEASAAAIFLFGVTAAVSSKAKVSGKSLMIGLSLLAAVLTGGIILNKAVSGLPQDVKSIDDLSKAPSSMRVTGVTVNPAVALGSTFTSDRDLMKKQVQQNAYGSSLSLSQSDLNKLSQAEPTRLNLSTTIIGLITGAVIGANLFVVLKNKEDSEEE
jgi:aquaporin aqpM